VGGEKGQLLRGKRGTDSMSSPGGVLGSSPKWGVGGRGKKIDEGVIARERNQGVPRQVTAVKGAISKAGKEGKERMRF